MNQLTNQESLMLIRLDNIQGVVYTLDEKSLALIERLIGAVEALTEKIEEGTKERGGSEGV